MQQTACYKEWAPKFERKDYFSSPLTHPLFFFIYKKKKNYYNWVGFVWEEKLESWSLEKLSWSTCRRKKDPTNFVRISNTKGSRRFSRVAGLPIPILMDNNRIIINLASLNLANVPTSFTLSNFISNITYYIQFLF